MIRCDRYNTLIGQMATLLGEEIPSRSKIARYVWARVMVAYEMTLENYPSTEIGRQMGRDHSTVIYYRNKMKDALDYPHIFPDIIEIWNEFKNTIDHEIQSRTVRHPVGL